MIQREMWRVTILVVCSFFLGMADSARAVVPMVGHEGLRSVFPTATQGGIA